MHFTLLYYMSSDHDPESADTHRCVRTYSLPNILENVSSQRPLGALATPFSSTGRAGKICTFFGSWTTQQCVYLLCCSFSPMQYTFDALY